jgi:hypothetical protein
VGDVAEHGGGSTTLEVRWIFRGRVPDTMLAWLGPFDDEVEEREDRYLVEPASSDLGVKIKGVVQLDLKVFRGSPGELVLPGGGLGRLELWEKWTFPLDGSALPPEEASAWLTLGKVRHRRSFRAAGGGVVERPVRDAGLPGCTVELTEVAVGGEEWWALGLEAGGQPESLRPVLMATVASLIQVPAPDDVALELSASMSYAGWLSANPWT